MTDPKTAPDPRIGSNPELLALCLEHIDECARLRDRLREREETVSRQTMALKMLEFALADEARQGAFSVTAEAYGEAMRLSDRAHDAYTD